MQTSARFSYWIWLLAIFNVGLHLVFYDHLEYHRDELLYFSLGGHPDAGYASVPPFIGLLAWVIQSTVGSSVVAVKLVPALLSGGMVLLAAALARELGGRRYGELLAAIGMVIAPLILRAFFLFQPVFLDIFFWTLSLYFLLRFINTSSDHYLYALGGTLGVGLLNKYTIALLAFCILLSLLLTRRDIFQRKALYGAALMALLVFSPNIIWQFTHDFPVIQHMEALKNSQLVHVDRMGFLVDQLLLGFTLSLLIWPGFYFLFKNKNYRSLGLICLFTIVILFLLQGKSYYTAGVYPLLIAAGAVWWENLLTRPFGRVALPLLLTLTIIPILPMGLPIYPVDGLITYFQNLEKKYGLDVGRRFEDGSIHSLPQDYADMLGWEELTQIVNKAYQQTGDKEKVIIFCDNYGQAGAISIIGKKYGLPEPVSLNESYFYWAPKQLDRDVQEFIYVNGELGEDIPQLFGDIQEIGRIRNPHARELGTQVYLCRQPKADVSATILKLMEDLTPF